MGKGCINPVHAPGGFAYLIRAVAEDKITILNQGLDTIDTLVMISIIEFGFGTCLGCAVDSKKQEAAGKPPLYTIK